jgi:hypothetical protein
VPTIKEIRLLAKSKNILIPKRNRKKEASGMIVGK